MSDLYQNSIHEVGHAAVASYYGLRVSRVWVSETPAELYGVKAMGMAEFWDASMTRPWVLAIDKQTKLRTAMVYMAGRAAAMRAGCCDTRDAGEHDFDDEMIGEIFNLESRRDRRRVLLCAQWAAQTVERLWPGIQLAARTLAESKPVNGIRYMKGDACWDMVRKTSRLGLEGPSIRVPLPKAKTKQTVKRKPMPMDNRLGSGRRL